MKKKNINNISSIKNDFSNNRINLKCMTLKLKILCYLFKVFFQCAVYLNHKRIFFFTMKLCYAAYTNIFNFKKLHKMSNEN